MARKLPPFKKIKNGLCEKCNAFGEVLEFMVPDQKHFRYSEDVRISSDQLIMDHRARPFHLCWDCAHPGEAAAREKIKQEEEARALAMEELAEVLHESRCLGPHEGNGCLFPIEKEWDTPSRLEWLRRAKVTRDSMPSLSIQEIIRVLTST